MEADSSGAVGAGGAGTNSAPGTDWLLVRVHVPELNVQKSLQFPKDQLVWDVKQQCLAALPKELKESFNYGLFCPPVNGKAGKFLDEERRLGDYPFNGPVGYLELKYKRRVYKMLKLDEKQLKALHTRANLRRFLEHVQNAQLDKVAKACAKGLDPNFHCSDTGETPLTIASGIKKPSKVLIALVNGGALLDYRSKDGSTAVHRAVETNSLEAVKTLLELGASPNYKDGKGLTPLYLSVTHKTDPLLCESLLHDHANIGAQDLQGWQEVHQACRNGLVQHLDHLLFYGADMNARNASGNTPLHVCAVNGQDSCARQLLFRGCDREALNFANQTPYQVAVIAGNMELAEVIKSYKSDEVVPFRGPPRYNPRRRSGVAWGPLCGWTGLPGDRTSMASTLTRIPCELDALLRSQVDGPPSPCSYDRPFSSASSSLSDGSHPSHEDNASIITVVGLQFADKSLGDTSDIISDSSGVGTNSDTTCSITLPGTTVVCLESYESNVQGHLRIRQGDIIEVTGASDCGLLEGTTRDGSCGLFPPRCVQEVRLRPGAGAARNATRAATQAAHSRRENPSHYSATAPRIKKIYLNGGGGGAGAAECRTVVLHRARRGFGFVLRGAKESSPLMELRPSERCPGLQYLDDVDKGGVADMAGLRKGDFLIAINGEDVSAASHEHVVDLIRSSGSLVSMTVVPVTGQQSPVYSSGVGGSGGVPTSKSVAALAAAGAVPPARQYATLPRKAPAGGGRSPAPAPPRRDPRTTLSVGRARAKSMVAGLENGGEREDSDTSSALGGLMCGGAPSKASSAESVQALGSGSGTPQAPRTASIRARPASSRITAAQLEELFQRQQDNADKSSSGGGMMTSSAFQEGASSSPPYSPAKLAPPFVPAAPSARVYASVAEMKRSKGKSWSRVRVGGAGTAGAGADTLGELRRDFHSTPDLALEPPDAAVPRFKYRSQEDVHINYGVSRLGTLPPPSHPPPPPPAGQLVAVEVLEGPPHAPPEPASADTPDAAVMSSFRPTDNAKLYASPQDVNAVAYRCRTTNTTANKHTVRKTQSLRTSGGPQPAQPLRQCSADDPNNQYAQPFKKQTFSRQSSTPTSAPPIPEPDYSMSESEEECAVTVAVSAGAGGVTRLSNVQLQPAETSANSNASGSSSGSGSMHHSFSVDEIQKIRTQLKCSKSYPNDFISQDGDGELELELDPRQDDGDNSSSGVSSDQELTIQQELPEKPHAPQPTRKMASDVSLINKMDKCTIREPIKASEPVRSKDKVSFNTNVMVKSSNNVITTEPVQLHSSSESISSSGIISVCSHRTTADADVPAPTPARYRQVTTPSGHLNLVNTQPGLGTLQRHNSLTRKQAASYLLKREPKPGQSAAERLGVNLSNAPMAKKEQSEPSHSYHKSSLMRNAVSLAQLPPPLEEVAVAQDVVLDATAGPEVPPLAPPPQFSDRVRIVAALPKQHSHSRLNH